MRDEALALQPASGGPLHVAGEGCPPGSVWPDPWPSTFAVACGTSWPSGGTGQNDRWLVTGSEEALGGAAGETPGHLVMAASQAGECVGPAENHAAARRCVPCPGRGCR